jgi:hypothetical protein
LDHGDHYHFIFSTSHSNNANRHLNSILNFLQASLASSAEAHTTLQPIKFIALFLAHLIRKGIRTFNKYGNKIIPILKDIITHLKTHTDEPDSNQFEKCEMYIDQKKDFPQEQIWQQAFSIYFINNLLATDNVTSFEDFQRKVPTDVKIRPLKERATLGKTS